MLSVRRPSAVPSTHPPGSKSTAGAAGHQFQPISTRAAKNQRPLPHDPTVISLRGHSHRETREVKKGRPEPRMPDSMSLRNYVGGQRW